MEVSLEIVTWLAVLIVMLTAGFGSGAVDQEGDDSAVDMPVVDPKRYFLNISINMDQSKLIVNYTAFEQIFFRTMRDSDELLFNCKVHYIISVEVKQFNVTIPSNISREGGYLRIQALNGTTFPKSNYLLLAQIFGVIDDSKSTGFFYTRHIDRYSKKESVNVFLRTKPDHADEAFICMNGMTLGVEFDVWVRHPMEFMAYFVTGNEVTYTFENTHFSKFSRIHEVPFYCVNFLLTENKQWTQAVGHSSMTLVAPRNHVKQFSFEYRYLLDIFHDYLLEYEFFSEGRDLLLYPDVYIYLIQNVTTSFWTTEYNFCTLSLSLVKLYPKNLGEVHNFAARCIAGLHITSRVYPDSWQNYYIVLGLTELYKFTFRMFFGGFQVYDDFSGLDDTYIEAFTRDESETPVVLADESGSYREVPTKKAACLMNMLKHLIGHNKSVVFMRVVRKFTQGANRMYSRQSFLDAFQNETEVFPTSNGITIEEFFDSWTLQRGYPILQVRRLGNSLHFNQVIFSPRDNWNGTTGFVIPISVYGESEAPTALNRTSPSLWLRPDDTNSTIELVTLSRWFLVNNQRTAYCRIIYDDVNYKLLRLEMLHGNLSNIGGVTRGQIVDDMMFLARHNLIRYDLAVDMLEYLKRESDYVAWMGTERELVYLERNLRFTTAHDLFRVFMKIVTLKFYKESVQEQKPISVPKMAIQWACFGRLRHCLDLTSAQLHAYVENDVTVEYSDLVLCMGMKTVDAKTFTFLLFSLNFNIDEDMRELYLLSLACLEERAYLTEFLHTVFRDHSAVIERISQRLKRDILMQIIRASAEGTLILLDFVYRHPDMVYANLREGLLPIFKEMAYSLYTRSQQRKLRKILQYYRFNDTVAVAAIWTNIREKYEWVSSHFAYVRYLLLEYAYLDVSSSEVAYDPL